MSGLLAACACAVPVGRVVDPGRAGTWGALLPSSKPWPELGAQREGHGGGGAEQSKPSGAAARWVQNTDKVPLGPGCRTSGEFWACCIKFLEMTTFRFLRIVGFNLQENLKEVEARCEGADSVALATVFSKPLHSPEQGPDRVLPCENKSTTDWAVRCSCRIYIFNNLMNYA